MAIQPGATGIWFYETRADDIANLLANPAATVTRNGVRDIAFNPELPITMAFNYDLPAGALHGVQGIKDSNGITVRSPRQRESKGRGDALNRLEPEEIYILLVDGPGKEAYVHFHPTPLDDEALYAGLAGLFLEPWLLGPYLNLNRRRRRFRITVADPDGKEVHAPNLRITFSVVSKPTLLYQSQTAALPRNPHPPSPLPTPLPSPRPIPPPCIKPAGTHNFTQGAALVRVALDTALAVPYFESA